MTSHEADRLASLHHVASLPADCHAHRAGLRSWSGAQLVLILTYVFYPLALRKPSTQAAATAS